MSGVRIEDSGDGEGYQMEWVGCERMAARWEVAALMVAFGMVLGAIDGLSGLPSPWSLGVAAIIIGVIVVGIPKIPRK